MVITANAKNWTMNLKKSQKKCHQSGFRISISETKWTRGGTTSIPHSFPPSISSFPHSKEFISLDVITDWWSMLKATFWPLSILRTCISLPQLEQLWLTQEIKLLSGCSQSAPGYLHHAHFTHRAPHQRLLESFKENISFSVATTFQHLSKPLPGIWT